jgi:uncharacterized repeat protein (TIGR01451 family)
MKTRKQFLHIFAVVGLLAGMLFGALGIRPAAAATVLGPGDIAIVGFSKVGDVSNFAFVLLVDIESGTQIRFTDAGWNETEFHISEGAVTYTAPVDLLAGNVITYSGPDANFEVIVEGPFELAGGIAFTNAGDQLLAFQGPYDNPIFLYALNNDDAGWTTSNTTSQTTHLPPGLTDGYTAISLGGSEWSGVFNGPFSGPREELLAAISDPDNWTYPSAGVFSPTLPFIVTPSIVLSISKQVDADEPVELGGQVTYTITLSNTGGLDAESVSLEDVLPASLVDVELAVGSEGEYDEDNHTLTWSGTVSPLEDVVVEFTAAVDDDLELLGTDIVNTASYTWGADPVSDTASFTVVDPSPASLSISKEVDADEPVELGGQVTYTITLSNSGQSDAVDVSLEDVLPTGLVDVELADESVGEYDEDNHTLTWTGTVPRLDDVVVEFTATVDEDADLYGTDIVNTASFEWGDTSGSDTASITIESSPVVPSPASLSISKSVTPYQKVALDGQVIYTIVLTNHGDTEAMNVVMTDIIPVSLTVLTVQGGGTTTGNTVSWTGSILGNSSKTIAFTAALSSSPSLFGQTISNTVTFTSTNTTGGQASVSFRVAEMPRVYLPVVTNP